MKQQLSPYEERAVELLLSLLKEDHLSERRYNIYELRVNRNEVLFFERTNNHIQPRGMVLKNGR